MGSTPVGFDHMTVLMRARLYNLVPRGYYAALQEDSFSWDTGRAPLAGNHFQEEGSSYCKVPGVAITHDSYNIVRGWQPTVNYTLDEYGKFIAEKRNLKLPFYKRNEWKKLKPSFAEVDEFIHSTTEQPFKLVKLKTNGYKDTLKELILTYGPVLVNVYADSTYNKFKANSYNDVLPPRPEHIDPQANHAIVVVGWCKAMLSKEYKKVDGGKLMKKPQPCWHIMDSKKRWGTGSKALLPFEAQRVLGAGDCWAVVPDE